MAGNHEAEGNGIQFSLGPQSPKVTTLLSQVLQNNQTDQASSAMSRHSYVHLTLIRIPLCDRDCVVTVGDMAQLRLDISSQLFKSTGEKVLNYAKVTIAAH